MAVIWPYFGKFEITKLYGAPPPKGLKYSSGNHAGVDFVGLEDKKVRAVYGGKVYKSNFDQDGWGNYIVIKQKDGLYGIYCHLSKSYKSTGQTVNAGDILGIEGKTGMVTGAHLHFELRRNYEDKYSTVEPCNYLGMKRSKGMVEGDEMEKQLKIEINGKTKTVEAIEKNGFNYVKLQDLRDAKIEVEFENGKPVIKSK